MNGREKDRWLSRLGSGFHPTQDAAMREAATLPPEDLKQLLERAQQRHAGRKRNLVYAGLAIAAVIAPLLYFADLAVEHKADMFFLKYLTVLVGGHFGGIGNSVVAYNADYWPFLIATLRGMLAATGDPRFLGDALTLLHTPMPMSGPRANRRYTALEHTLESLWNRAMSGICVMLPVVTEAQYTALRPTQKAGLYSVLDAPARSLVLTHAVLLAVAKWKDVQALPAVTRLAEQQKGSRALAEIRAKARAFLLQSSEVAGDPEEDLLEAARRCRASLEATKAGRTQSNSLLRASDSVSTIQPATLLRPLVDTASAPVETLLRAVSSTNGDAEK